VDFHDERRGGKRRAAVFQSFARRCPSEVADSEQTLCDIERLPAAARPGNLSLY
jgi:hypothetical protein